MTPAHRRREGVVTEPPTTATTVSSKAASLGGLDDWRHAARPTLTLRVAEGTGVSGQAVLASLANDRPPLMISPPPSNLEVGRRKAFLAKAAGANQGK